MKATIASIITACFLSSCDLAGITSDPVTTTILGNDGSSAIITALSEDDWSFTWSQASPSVDEAESTGEVILITDDGK